MSKSELKGVEEWWRPEKGHFFSDVYYQGDHSLEGWLLDKKMSIDQRTYKEISGVKNILDLKKDDVILDVPCGWGKHTSSLSSQNYNVIGLDINDKYLNIAKATSRLLKPGTANRFFKGDMRQLPFRSEEFTVVLNLVLSFGFFSDEDNFKTLKEMSRVIVKGGRLLLHTDINPPMVFNNKYKDISDRRLVDGSKLIVSEEYDAKEKRIIGYWEIRNLNKKTKRFYSLRIYTNDEMERMFHEVGMKLENIYGSLDENMTPYTDSSQEVVYVATKIK
jgi:ubiquinone/menaquinone biosynthesis C-methylase UbiE